MLDLTEVSFKSTSFMLMSVVAINQMPVAQYVDCCAVVRTESIVVSFLVLGCARYHAHAEQKMECPSCSHDQGSIPIKALPDVDQGEDGIHYH